MVPFCNFDMNLWQSLIYTEKTFWVNQDISNEEYEKRYFLTLEKALNSSADFIVFPEMVYTKNIDMEMKEFLRNRRENNAKIIIAGSSSDDHENNCYVYDMRGNLI